MPHILAVETQNAPYCLTQQETMEFARYLFRESFQDIERLLTVFNNGDIKTRYFTMPIDWFKTPHTFQEKNDEYIEKAVSFGKSCIEKSMNHSVSYNEIDAIFFISTTGLATPSIDARIMNELPFSPHTKRIPIWGLGCAGGASGFSRGYEYCLAYPKSNVLVLSIELCSLTFQHGDHSKSNLVGTSLFADGTACALICGDQSRHAPLSAGKPMIMDTMSTLMPHSEEVMGWEVKDDGLYVVFSRDIPNIIQTWFRPNIETFLSKHGLGFGDITHFIAHPGGKKVLTAYRKALHFSEEKTRISQQVLERNGNMSSATVFYVLKDFMETKPKHGELGIMAALGPGFSSELLLLRW